MKTTLFSITLVESVELKTSGSEGQPITFEAAEPGEVIIRGSSVVTGWAREPGESPVYVHDGWSKYFSEYLLTEVRNAQGNIRRKDGRDLPRNQVFSNGLYVSEVFSRKDVTENFFYIDRENKRIYLWLSEGDDPNKRQIEVTDRDFFSFNR